MSFVERTYPDIVRDVLTSLTQGVVGEVHQIEYDPFARPRIVPDVNLSRRPVRRVSLVQGYVQRAEGETPAATDFTLDDYELIANPDDPTDYSSIRFRPFARNEPAPGTALTVNYYPRTTDPTPLTDLNVGSVTRTIVEAMSREIAGLYAQLNIAYDSGFIETATGLSLDRVVALLSYSRLRAGRAVGSVTFTRRPGSLGFITIPAGTPITDTSDKIRYVTSERYDMLVGESLAEVRVQGAGAGTPAVEANVLTVVQRAIAGIDSVANGRPTARASEDETDEALRARTRDALLTANKGTVEALRHGLLALPSVRDATINEMPNGVAGEISVTVQLAGGAASTLPSEVTDRIEALRPAGIRVLTDQAAEVSLGARLRLVLSGSSMVPSEIEAVHNLVRETLVAHVKARGVGELIRVKPALAATMNDGRIADATLALGPKDGLASEGDFQPATGESTILTKSDISFDPDSFAEAPRESGPVIPVDIQASLGATSVGDTAVDAIRAELEQRLNTYVQSWAVGQSIDSASMLQALQNDAKYALDPLRLSIVLTAQDQFVQLAQGGQSFTVKPSQIFKVSGVELRS